MYRILCITAFSFVCIVVNCNKCKPIKEQGKKDYTEDYIRKITEDALNVTKYLDDYVANLREFIKSGRELPPDTIKYYLFTSENLKEPYNVTTTKGSFRNIPYNNKKPLAFGIHGYVRQAGLTSGLMGELVEAVVKLNKYNVIFVDYSKLNDDVLSVVYPRVLVAAKHMAKFLQFLMDETGTKREQIHVIGVSLGAQMTGMIGRSLSGLGRITGLDPGGSFVDYFPEDLRLDRSDAIFVDVIHTADEYPLPKGWGYYKPCGHLDFYPNGGLFQPGCNSTIPIDQMPTTPKEVSERLCMHNRMEVYYIESTCGECSFIGTMCESYEKFQNGLCTASNSRTALMGEFATKPPMDLPEDARFFLDTNDHYPFCKLQQPNKVWPFPPLTFFWSLFQ